MCAFESVRYYPDELQTFIGAHMICCMNDDCKIGRISLRVLQKILDGRILQQLLQRSQLDEIRAANLDNMDTCPFCDFAMIIDNVDERLFQCRNSTCLRESCRLVSYLIVCNRSLSLF